MRKNIYELIEYKNILFSFVKKCKENNIWFSLSNKTLLSSLTEINYFNQDDYLEVFMLLNDFEKLKTLFPNNIIDPKDKDNFYALNPFFVDEISNVVIKINILVPASIKKTEKFYSFRNKRRQQIGYWASFKSKSYWYKKIYYSLWRMIDSNLSWFEIYTNIYNEKYNGYFIVDNFSLNINQNWIPSLTKEVENINFLDIECPILKEYEVFLNRRYGLMWKEKISKKNQTKIEYKWIKETYFKNN